jgi:hypothetical protein
VLEAQRWKLYDSSYMIAVTRSSHARVLQYAHLVHYHVRPFPAVVVDTSAVVEARGSVIRDRAVLIAVLPIDAAVC